MLESLKGRVALITGASSGIGEGAAISLAEQGVKIFATGRRQDRLDELKARIEGLGSECEVLAGDVVEEDFARSLVGKTVERFGKLDILINSAGVMYFDKVEGADMKLWRHSMDLNLYATVYTCSEAIPVMKAQGRGDIINISSTAGRRMMGGPYGTSKIALNSFHEGLRSEVGLAGIRLCIIEPGATTSEIWAKPEPRPVGLPEEPRREGRGDEARGHRRLDRPGLLAAAADQPLRDPDPADQRRDAGRGVEHQLIEARRPALRGRASASSGPGRRRNRRRPA
jgi:NADP-dependent 3-hydroxy acid dehydrogenase YdfG